MTDDPPRWEADELLSTANVEVRHEFVPAKDSPRSTPTEEVPPTTPAPDPATTHPRGTLVFERERADLIQKIEMRGNNGVSDAPNDVETKYLLTGGTYTIPTDLIQLDHHEFFHEVTETRIRYDVGAIADHVARIHKKGPAPKLFVAVHTHPSGSTRPSRVDKTNPTALKEALSRHFDDFEFFRGIHGLGDKHIPSSKQLREVHEGDGHIWWYGENRRHELALYDERYRTCEISVKTNA